MIANCYNSADQTQTSMDNSTIKSNLISFRSNILVTALEHRGGKAVAKNAVTAFLALLDAHREAIAEFSSEEIEKLADLGIPIYDEPDRFAEVVRHSNIDPALKQKVSELNSLEFLSLIDEIRLNCHYPTNP